eukprot:RCo003054
MALRPTATKTDVQEAFRLFKNSTMEAMNSGVQELTLDSAQVEEIHKVEAAVRRRLGVGMTALYQTLRAEFLRQGFAPPVVDRALLIMTRREEIEWKQQRKYLTRRR